MRPGLNRALKLELASLSADAARILGGGITRECADVRVAHAVVAGLSDPALSAKARARLAGLGSGLADEADDDARGVTLRFRVTADEADRIRRRAEEAGQTASEYLRQAALG